MKHSIRTILALLAAVTMMAACFPALAEKVGDVSNGLAIYLSTAPSLFESTIKGLESVGLAGETVRIGLEKPLGYDLAHTGKSEGHRGQMRDRRHRTDRFAGRFRILGR